MKYMLDTNICIYAIKKSSQQVIASLLSHKADDICISSITYAELMYGVAKSANPEKNTLALSLFLSPFTILDFDDKAATQYGRIRAALGRKRTTVGNMDMLIAAHALSHGLTVVTNNTGEFERIPDIELEDWTK